MSQQPISANLDGQTDRQTDGQIRVQILAYVPKWLNFYRSFDARVDRQSDDDTGNILIQTLIVLVENGSTMTVM